MGALVDWESQALCDITSSFAENWDKVSQQVLH